MEASRKRLVSALVLAGLLLALALIQSAAFYRSVRLWGTRVWPGWYVLITDQQEDPRKWEPVLLSAGIEEVLHRNNLMVSYPAGLKRAEVPLAELSTKLIPEDPRWDPYLRRLPRLFADRTGEKQLIYLKSSISLWELREALQKNLKDSSLSWQLAEWNLTMPLMALGFGLIYLLVLTALFPREAFYVFLGSLAWIPMIFHSGGALISLALALHSLWIAWISRARRLLPRGRRRPGSSFWWTAFTLVAGHLAALAVLVIQGKGVFLLLSAAVSEVFLFILLERENILVPAGHSLFEPLILCPWRSRETQRSRWQRSSFLLLPLLLFPLIPLTGRDGGESFTIPRPRGFSREGGQGERIENPFRRIQKAASDDSEQPLPQISGYVAHRAYGEGYLFGREYGMPRENEELRLDWFSRGEGELRRENRVVVRYDQAWLAGILTLREEGLQLMAAPGINGKVSWGKALPRGISWFQGVGLFLISLVLVMPLVWRPRDLTLLFGRTVRNSRSRRRNKAA